MAYCARQTRNIELRIKAYSSASEIFTNQHDFLMFIHYCVKISENMYGRGKLNFGRGLRRAVAKWYSKHDPVALANMFGEHRGICKWTHSAVIRKAHHRTKKPGVMAAPAVATVAAPADTPVAATVAATVAAPAATPADTPAAASSTGADGAASAAPSTAPPSSAPAVAGTSTEPSAPSTSAAVAGTSAAPSAPSTSAAIVQPIDDEPDDRKDVFHFVFCSSSNEYLDYLATKTELGAGAQRLKHLQHLKTNEDLPSALQAIREHNIALAQVPAHLLEHADVWDVLMPTMSFHELLKYFHTIRDHGFLNPNHPLARSLIEKFADRDQLKAERICPIRVYITTRLYKKNVRYLSVKKAELYSKKVAKRHLEYNADVRKHLNKIFFWSLNSAKPMPANFCITMDLREGNKKRTH